MARSSSDETYLESFVEHIATLPAEVRRNLDLMKDLDETTAYVTPCVCVGVCVCCGKVGLNWIGLN